MRRSGNAKSCSVKASALFHLRTVAHGLLKKILEDVKKKTVGTNVALLTGLCEDFEFNDINTGRVIGEGMRETGQDLARRLLG